MWSRRSRAARCRPATSRKWRSRAWNTCGTISRRLPEHRLRKRVHSRGTDRTSRRNLFPAFPNILLQRSTVFRRIRDFPRTAITRSFLRINIKTVSIIPERAIIAAILFRRSNSSINNRRIKLLLHLESGISLRVKINNLRIVQGPEDPARTEYENLPKRPYAEGQKESSAPQWHNLIEWLLKKEVREEVNVEIDKPEYLTDLVFIRPDGYPVATLSYWAWHESGEAKPGKDLTEVAWVTAEEAKQYDLIEGIAEEIEEVEKIIL